MSKRTLVYLLICCFCYGLMANNASFTDKAKTLTEYFTPTTDLKNTDNYKKAVVTDPVVTISTPADGAEFPVGTDLTVEATATDNGSIRNIRLILNGTTIRKINGASGTWEPPTDPELADLEAGDYEIKVVAVDNQGNTGESIHNITVSDDVDPPNMIPIVSITAPADGAAFLLGDDINVTADASDSDGNITSVELFLDDASQGEVTATPYGWTLSNLAVGSYILKAVATDDDGATGEASISVTVREDTGENVPPTVSFTNPSDGDTFTEGDDLTVTAAASDSDGNITGVEFLFDGNSQGTDNTAPYEWSLQNLAVGTYNLQVIATDDSMATDQQTISITVEEIADDGTPRVTISTPDDGDTFPVGTDLTVEASATDSDGTIRNIRLIMNGSTIRKINGASGTWGPPTDPELADLEAGTYDLRVVAVDNQGNRGETTHTITVGDDNGGENEPPIVSFVSPDDDAMFTVGADIAVEASASDSDGSVSQVELFLDDASQGVESTSPYGWTLSNLAIGTYTLKVVATDNEGATDEESISITVKDENGGNVPPTVSFTNPSDGEMFTEGDDLTVTAMASDGDGSVTGVEFIFDGNSQGTDNTAPYEWSLQNLAVGTYDLQVIATDDSLATSQQTISITVKEEQDCDGIPVVIISTPADGAMLPVGADLTVEASATDCEGSIRNIRLLVNGSTIRKINGVSGTWGPPTDPELADLEAGTYELRVVAVDNSGNRGETTHTITVGDDNGGENRPPSVSFASPNDGAMFIVGNDIEVEANASDSDGTISQTELFVDDVSQGTEALAPYEWTLSGLAVGTYTLKVVATDNEGATDEESISITVKEDDGSNAPPSVSFTNPSDGDMFDEGTDITVTADASDSDGSVSQVELFANGDSQGTEALVPYEWDLQNLPAGSYELRLVATDDDGATAESTINITVKEDDTGGDGIPVVTISTPDDGDVFPVGTDLTVEASATDSDGTIRNIRLLVNGTTIRKINGASGTWGPPTDPELADLEAGTYELRVVAVDNQGNRGETTHTITVGDDNGGENRPPMVEITSPNDGDVFFVGNNIQVEATASDSDGNVTQLELFLNDDSQGTEALAPYQWILADLAVGSYTIRVVATDDDGATSEDMISISVREQDGGGDNLPPTVSFSSPNDGDMFDRGDDLTVVATASDPDGTISQVELFANDDSQGTETVAPYEWTLQNLPVGTYELRLVATDNDGSTAEATITITVKDDDPVDDGTPVVTISTPDDGDTFPVGTDLTVEASATDSDGTIRNIRLLVNGTTIRKINGASGTWGPPTDPELADLEAGTYELRVVAVDNQGNRGETTHTITVGDDNGGENTPPTVNFTNPNDGDVLTEGTDLIVTVDASDSDGTVTGVELLFNGASQGTDDTAPYEWTIPNLEVGTFNMKATATDNDGAFAEQLISITVEEDDGMNTPPSVSFTNPSNGDTFTEGDNLTVTATASDSDGNITGVEFIFDGNSQGTDNTAPYEWSLTNLAVGTYNLQVIATDDSMATAQQTISITVEEEDVMDDGIPRVTISTPDDGAVLPVGTDLTVEASATDSDGSIRNIRLFLNEETVRRINSSSGTWGPPEDPELENMQKGVYDLRVVAVDNRGNTGETTHTITVSPISASFVLPEPNQVFPEGSNVVVEVDADTNEGRIRRVNLYLDEVFVRTESRTPYEWGLSTQNDLELANMSPGNYDLRAEVISSTGDTLNIASSFVVSADIEPLALTPTTDGEFTDSTKDQKVENRGREKMMNIPPVTTIHSPADGQTFTAGSDLTVTASATDEDGRVRNIRMYFDGNFVRKINGDSGEWNGDTDPELANLQVGEHTIRVGAVDNGGASSEVTITINVVDDGENVPPTLSFITPMDGETFPEGIDLNVEVDANDSDGSITGVDLYINDNFVRNESLPPYIWGSATPNTDLPLQDLPAGTHELRAVATDNEGATTTEIIIINVEGEDNGGGDNGGGDTGGGDNGGGHTDDDQTVGGEDGTPITTIVSPRDGDVFPVGTNLTVVAEADDPDGRVRNVRMYFNDEFISKINNPPYEWSGDDHPELANLQEGDYDIRVGSVDNSGKSSELTITITVSDEVPNDLPSVSFDAPSDGAEVTTGDDVAVEVSASDNDGTVTGVEFFLDDVLVSNDDTAPYEWTINAISEGAHTLKAIATDDDGDTNETSISITAITDQSDNLPPTVSFTTPSNGDSFTEGDNLSVTATANDEDGSVTQVEFFFDGTSQGTDDTAPYEWTYEGLTVGSYDLKVVATDDEGATAESTISITVESDNGGENTPPTVNFTNPSDGDSFIEGDDLVVTVDASDSDGTIDGVELLFNGTSQGVDNEAPYEWTISNLEVGNFNMKATATDNEGAFAEQLISIGVEEMDDDLNTPPTVSFTTPNDGDIFTEGDDLIVTVAASDGDGTVTDVELYYDDNLVGSDDEDPYTWMILNLTEGTHTLRAKATDDDGAETETSISITVEAEDTGGDDGNQTAGGEDGTPITTIVSPKDGDVLPVGSDLTVVAEASDPDGRVRNVRMYLNGDFISKINNPPYEWSGDEHPELANLQEGSYDIRVGAVDNQGKSSEVTITITVSDDGGGDNGGGDNGGGDNGGGTDEVDPVVNFTQPTDGQTFEEGDNIQVTASASDEDGTISKVDLYLDDVFVRTETNAPYDWGDQQGQDTELENMQPGMYDLRVVATDNDGNTDSETITIVVNAADDGGGDNGGGDNGGGSTEGAQISIENRTKLPILETSFPADDIYSFCHVNKPSQTMTDEHNRNTMRIHSTGTANLVISEINISDTSEYTLPNNDWDQLPITIAPGDSYDLLIQFVESRGQRGFRGQNIELVTNDADNPTVSAELRGAYNIRAEGNSEPHVRTIIQTLGFKTDIGGNLNTGLYPEPADVEAGDYGDLVLSEVWERANPDEPVIGINLAVYKGGGQTQGSGLNTRFVNVDNLQKVGNFNFNTCAGFHQSILAKNKSCASYDLVAGIERDAVDVPFRIVMDGYISDGKGEVDPVTGRRHLLAIRMFQVVDNDGNVIPNHYIALNDYVKNGCSEADGASPDDEFANCDWNDNITYFINIQPVNPLAIGNVSMEEVEQRFGKIARQKELHAYPNPVQQELNIDLTSFMDEEVNLMIQDQVGKVVQVRDFDNNHSMIETLDLGQFNAGFYILTLRSGDVQLTKKIIVSQQ
ncbi:MAG: Ig-like domain-containing protein [Bacteroidota bacterium]